MATLFGGEVGTCVESQVQQKARPNSKSTHVPVVYLHKIIKIWRQNGCKLHFIGVLGPKSWGLGPHVNQCPIILKIIPWINIWRLYWNKTITRNKESSTILTFHLHGYHESLAWGLDMANVCRVKKMCTTLCKWGAPREPSQKGSPSGFMFHFGPLRELYFNICNLCNDMKLILESRKLKANGIKSTWGWLQSG